MLYFPVLEPWVAQSVSLPSYSSRLSLHKCGTTLSSCCPPATALLDRPFHPGCPRSVSDSPTSRDECFFCNSLVFGLLYNLIFWQFWFPEFFVFKLVVFLLLIMRGSEAYLPLPPSWLEVLIFPF
ncbi:hypothetical protein HJG60_010264 [Phyllostomus discolor]|uniref:Uncharacterized protein n=1 Tax=Phyllostomus discolor TaxID=89673 RepID=A0A834B1I0_9CHIR|nr:hypothetical protein HJG60_010264 [Phyllostomus discolor]